MNELDARYSDEFGGRLSLGVSLPSYGVMLHIVKDGQAVSFHLSDEDLLKVAEQLFGQFKASQKVKEIIRLRALDPPPLARWRKQPKDEAGR